MISPENVTFWNVNNDRTWHNSSGAVWMTMYRWKMCCHTPSCLQHSMWFWFNQGNTVVKSEELSASLVSFWKFAWLHFRLSSFQVLPWLLSRNSLCGWLLKESGYRLLSQFPFRLITDIILCHVLPFPLYVEVCTAVFIIISGFTGSCWKSDDGGQTSPPLLRCKHRLHDIRTCKRVLRRTCTDSASHCSESRTQPCLM